MRKYFAVAIILFVAVTGSAFAADDGNTKWRLSSATLVSSGSAYDIIPTTNGTGNVKGVHCNSAGNVTLAVYVNGGSAETFTFDIALNDDGFIPFNIRFSSSIRVTGNRSGGSNYEENTCYVSWGLD